MKRDALFQLAYTIVGLGVGVMLTLLVVSASQPRPTIKYTKGCPTITQDTAPNVVDRCISGPLAQLGTFPAAQLGLPADGYCEDRSNGVSWRVIKCMGTQPESQP